MPTPIKLACIGAGYFARFHVEAWLRIPEVEVVAICDQESEKAEALAREFGIEKVYTNVQSLFDNESLDVVDIITPPNTHYALVLQAANHGVHIICQKPLAPNLQEAKEMVTWVARQQLRFMVHENFRFQPWYRKIKQLITTGAIGEKLHSLHFRLRTGDGWPDDAYLHRQPYFRTMPRLLIYETGIHFIDTFRYLAGEVQSIYADLRQLNAHIAGEDCGLVLFNFANGAKGVWDANRYNEPNTPNARYTFGELLLEGSGGSIRLYTDGQITLQPLGEAETSVPYSHENKNFAGDCVYFTQRHFINNFLNGTPFETSGADYLNNLIIQEAIYESAAQGVVKSCKLEND